MKGCEFILSSGERLNYAEMRQHLLEKYPELIQNNGTLIPPTPPKENTTRVGESGKKARKTYESIINRSTELSKEQREAAINDPNRFYTPQSSEESQKIAADIVDNIGIENAVELATSNDTSIPEVIKVAILGEATSRYAKESKTSSEVDAFDKFEDALKKLAEKSTELGRAISQLKKVYTLSGLGLVAKLNKSVQERTDNNYTKEEIDKRVAEVKAALEKELGNLRIDFEKKVTEEKDQEIRSTINKLNSQRTQTLNKAISLVQKLRERNKGKLYDATLGIPAAILDGGLLMLEYSLMAGLELNLAIENAVDKMKELMAKENKTFDKEKEFKEYLRKEFGDLFNEITEEQTISTEPKEDMVEKAKEKIERQAKKTKIGNLELNRSAAHKILKFYLNLDFNKNKLNELQEAFTKAGYKLKLDEKTFKYTLVPISNQSTEIPKNLKELLKEYNKAIENQSKLDDIIKEGLGLKLSEEDSKLALELAEKISNPKIPFFIRSQYEEILQYIFKKNSINLKYYTLRDGMVSSQLSGLWNFIQNATGFSVVLTRLFITALKTKSTTPFKVFAKEMALANQEAKTILAGRVSRGVSYKDLISSKSIGEVAVRYLEYFKGNNIFWKTATAGKYVGRLLEAVDTFASAASAGLSDYLKVKMYVEKFYPELSNTEKLKLEFDIMYGETTQKDIRDAINDLKAAGVSNPTKAEINRTIYERLTRARDTKLKEIFDNIYNQKLVEAEQYIKDNNLTNTPEEIEKWARIFAGDFDAIVGDAQEQAQIDTGKASTMGVATALAKLLEFGLSGVSRELQKQKKEGGLKTRGLQATEMLVTRGLFPFSTSIARWTELGMELTPYGLGKGALYKIGGLLTKDSKKSQKLNQLASDFMLRSMMGLLYASPYIAYSLLKGDDDEDEIVQGVTKKDKYGEEQVASAGLPKQSLEISDTRKLPLQLLGTASYAYMWYAEVIKKMKDVTRENKTLSPEEQDNIAVAFTNAAFFTTLSIATESSWLQSAERYGGSVTKLVKEGEISKSIATAGGRVVASIIPFNRLQQDIGQLISSKSKQQDNFSINVINQFSITKAVTPGKPNVDYRGREYDTGDMFINSIDGLQKFIFGRPKYRDEVDEWLTSIKFSVSTAYRKTKSEDLETYNIIKDEIRNLDDEEFYKFKVLAAEKFNNKIVKYYESERWKRLETDAQKRSVVAALVSDAKKEAIAEMNEMSPEKYKAKRKQQITKEEGNENDKVSQEIKRNRNKYKD